MNRWPRLRGEDGASMTLALAFLTLFGVLSVSLLSLTSASFKISTVADNKTDQLYAADAGIEYGVQNLDADSTKCASSGTSHTWPATTINGSSVQYSCSWVSGGTGSGSSGLLGGYAAVLGSGGLQMVGGPPLTLLGNMYSQGPISLTGVNVQIQGNLERSSSSCPNAQLVSAILTVVGSCTASVAAPNPNPAPTVGNMPSTALASQPGATANCTILYPGKYGSGGLALPSLVGKRIYMASGTYYFNSTGNVGVTGTEIFGGAKAAGENQLISGGPCSNDAEATTKQPTYAPVGTGVTLILGGDSRLSGTSARIELFSPSGISIWARTTTTGAGTGYNPATTTSSIVSLTGGETAVHGVVYVPESDITGTGGTVSQLAGGVVAKRLTFTGTVIGGVGAGGGAPSARTVTLTAVATAPDGATSTVTATIQPDALTPVITNWRKTP